MATSHFSYHIIIVSNEPNNQNKRVLEMLNIQDPILFDIETIDALKYLSKIVSISILDYPKLKRLGELKLIENLKRDIINKSRHLHDLRVFINAVCRVPEFEMGSSSTLLILLTNLINLDIQVAKHIFGYKEVNVNYNRSFERDLQNVYITTDQNALINMQKNAIKNTTTNTIMPDLRFEEIEPISFANIGASIVNAQINLQYTMAEMSDEMNLKQVSFLNIPLENQNRMN